MRNGTIFKYELKRLLLSKQYLLLLVATLIFSVSLLRGTVLFGANYTAPFSLLTFSTYCASLTPFLFILLLVLCAKQSVPYERGAEAIISATPMPLPVFRLLRYGAIAVAFVITAALPMIACFVFYRLIFDYTGVGVLLVPGLLLIMPPSIFLFGAAMLLGTRKAAAVYVLLILVLIVSIFQIPLPGVVDLAGSSADFELTSAFIAGRVVFAGIGIAFILASLFPFKKQRI